MIKFGALEDTGGSWLGFSILIFGYSHWSLIQLWSKLFALYLDFEGAKNIHVLYVLIWGFGGCWRFLTGVWNLHLDLDMVTGLWYTHDSNFGSLSWFWRCKVAHYVFKQSSQMTSFMSLSSLAHIYKVIWQIKWEKMSFRFPCRALSFYNRHL